MELRCSNPLERFIELALQMANEPYLIDGDEGNKTGLDFYLPDKDLYIEVKLFHSPRVATQMLRAENIIVVQGRKAVGLLSKMIVSDSLVDDS